MKRILTLTLILTGFLTAGLSPVFAQSESARKAFQRGIKAYNEQRYKEALPDLMLAANAEIPEAYGPLVEMYVDGDYNGSGRGNYAEALKWVDKAADLYLGGKDSNGELVILCLRDYNSLKFLTGEYESVADLVPYHLSKGTPVPPYVLLQLAASHMMLGNTAKAKEWIDKTKTEAQKENQQLIVNYADMLLAKMLFDNKEYDKAIDLLVSKNIVNLHPVSAYVYGASLIKTNNNPETGKQWVQIASEYDYSGMVELNCFEKEIKQYWNSIKN